MRSLLPPSPPKPPVRKRPPPPPPPPSTSRSARAVRKAQRREGSNDTLLRLMRGEEVLDSTYATVFDDGRLGGSIVVGMVVEADLLGELASTAQHPSEASSTGPESTHSAPLNVQGSSIAIRRNFSTEFVKFSEISGIFRKFGIFRHN